MTHLQVHAKSGLHAGATWSLEQTFVFVGSNPNSEVFLCDSGVPDRLLALRRSGRKYIIDSLHDDARLVSSDQNPADRVLMPAKTLKVDFQHIQLELSIQTGSGGMVYSLADTLDRAVYSTVQFLRSVGLRAVMALLFLIGLAITVGVMFFGTMGGVEMRPKPADSALESLDMSVDSPKLPLSKQMARTVATELGGFAEKYKTDKMSVQVEDTKVALQAELSRAQLNVLEGLMTRLMRDYGRFVDLQATVSLTPQQQALDKIEVAKVVLGQKPVVVLRDGSRLYLGARVEDAELIGISTDRLTFEADTLYEVML
ncbi:MAG: hypothetical protein HC848_00820 [Limnobacter sp.]|nr:hypothetical protein [Limnobacter sp.]